MFPLRRGVPGHTVWRAAKLAVHAQVSDGDMTQLEKYLKFARAHCVYSTTRSIVNPMHTHLRLPRYVSNVHESSWFNMIFI